MLYFKVWVVCIILNALICFKLFSLWNISHANITLKNVKVKRNILCKCVGTSDINEKY